MTLVIRHVPAWAIKGASVALGLALVHGSIGLVAGPQAAQAALASAGCACLADEVATSDRVARRVCAASVASLASAAACLAARPFGAVQALALAWVLLAAMCLFRSPRAARCVVPAALLSMVFALFVPAFQSPTRVCVASALAGSVGYWTWAVATAWLLQPTWRNRALASNSEGLARLFAAIAHQVGQPAESTRLSEIQTRDTALAERLQRARDLVFAGDVSPRACREATLLLHLIDLHELAMASGLGAGPSTDSPCSPPQARLLGRILERVAALLQTIAGQIRSENAPPADPRLERLIPSLLAELDLMVLTGRAVAGGSTCRSLRRMACVLQSLQAAVPSV